MKLTIPQPELAKALAFVSGAVSTRSPLPILSNVLLTASERTLKLTGTDLEIQKTITVGASIASEGAVTVPAKKLNDIVKSANQDSDIQMTLNDKQKLVVKSGRSRFTLTTIPHTEYPAFSGSDNPHTVDVDSAELSKSIKATFPCVAQQDVRYYLKGMMFDVSGSSLNVVATDGHRLAKASLQCASSLTKQAIVPRNSVSDIQKMLDSSSQSLITFSDSHITVTSDNMTLLSKLIDGKYPAYERVIPKNNPDTTTANRQELVSACNRGLILANEQFKSLRITISEGELTITGNNPEHEQAEEAIPCLHVGGEKEVGVNGKYLLDALAPIESENVVINSSSPQDSMLIEDGNLTMVVMPVHI